MPMAGIGTFLLTPDEAEASVLSALECGYRLIDTANAYVNEKGRWPGHEAFWSVQGRKSFWRQNSGPACMSSRMWLKKRCSAWIRITLIFFSFISQQATMLLDTGRWRKPIKRARCGLSGCPTLIKEQIREILDICEVKPAVLQTEVHPYYQEKGLKFFLSEQKMYIQAWYPLGHGDKALLEEPLFAELGKKYGKSNAQIILRWHIQAGNIVIPGSKNPTHIKDNFALFDFELTEEEMARIAALDKNTRYYTSTPQMLKAYAEMMPDVMVRSKKVGQVPSWPSSNKAF